MCLERFERQYTLISLQHSKASKAQGHGSQGRRQTRLSLRQEETHGQRGLFLLHLLSAVLPTIANLILRKTLEREREHFT